MIGIEERSTLSGIRVFRVHYTADPAKCDPDWQAEAARGMIGGKKGKSWLREMEIDWTVATGIGIYADLFNRNLHVSDKPLEAYQDLPIYRGWDISPTHIHPACVIAQRDPLGRLNVLQAICSWNGRGAPKAMDIDQFADDVLVICNELYSNTQWIDWADPAGWTKSMTDNRSCIDVMRNKGILPKPGPVTFTARKTAMNDILSRMKSGESAILVSCDCQMVVEGFGGAYKYEQVGETNKYKPTADKNAWSHPMNGLEYVVGGLYVPHKKQAEPVPVFSGAWLDKQIEEGSIRIA